MHELSLEDVFCKESAEKVYTYLSQMIANPSCTGLHFISDHDYAPILVSQKENRLQANFFIDDLYVKKEASESFITYRNNLSKLILNYMKKLNQKLSNINRKLEECKNTELYRLYGELIMSNLYRIKEQHLEEIALENYYDDNHMITIPLDKSITPSLNAKNYFKKYHKLKNAKQIVEVQKKDVQNEIQYLESIIYEFGIATTVADIDTVYYEFSENFLNQNGRSSSHKNCKKSQKKQKVSKKSAKLASQIGESLKYQIDGFQVIVGKNNKQNDYITKHANDTDIWFHTKDVHGSHVILKTENKEPSQDTINRVAALTAFYSKASTSSNVSVDYTNVKYVKKPSGAKPGMVIYTNYKNVIVKPQKEDFENSNM